MALTERLSLIIDADGQGAIREMDKIGKAAERDLGRAETRIDKMGAGFTSAGTKMMATSAVLGVALWDASKATSDLAEAADYSGRVFGQAGDEISAFAESAESIGLSERAAFEAATTFGDLLKATKATKPELADMSIEMTKLAGDMASAKNTTPEDAIEALGAALRGESEPIRRYGVMLDDATLKQKALDMGLVETAKGTLPINIKMQAAYAEILEQTTGMQGNFADTADGAANKSRVMAAQIENAKATIGEGFLPVMSSMVGLLSGAADKFGDVNEASGGMVGNIAGVGTVVLGAGGALSFVVGKAIEARDSLKALAESGSKLGSWASANAAALGGLGLTLGAAVVAWQMWSAGQEEARASAAALAETLDKQTGALTENSDALLENKLRSKNQLDDLGRAGATVKEFTAAIEDGTDAQIDWNMLSQTTSNGSSVYVDSLRGRTDAMSELIVKMYDANELNGGIIQTLHDEAGAYTVAAKNTRDAASATEDSAWSIRNLITAKRDEATATDVATEATDDNAKAWDEAKKKLDEYVKGIEDFWSIIDSSTDQAMAWEAAIDNTAQTLGENGLQWDYVRDRVDITTEAGRENMEVLQGQAEVIRQAGVAIVEAGGGAPAAAAKVRAMSGDFQTMLGTMGYTPEQVQIVLSSLGLLPHQIDMIFAANIDDARNKLIELTNRIANMKAVAASVGAASTAVSGAVSDIFGGARAGGGPVEAGKAYLVGEKGPELAVMGQSGTVIPANQTRALMGGGGAQQSWPNGDIVVMIDGLEFYRRSTKRHMQADVQGNNGFGGR